MQLSAHTKKQHTGIINFPTKWQAIDILRNLGSVLTHVIPFVLLPYMFSQSPDPSIPLRRNPMLIDTKCCRAKRTSELAIVGALDKNFLY
jgi:hypothetical protein